jgi:hypothetical protein
LAIALILLGVVAARLISDYIPVGVDFRYTFYPVAKATLTFQSPYTVPNFLMPPWTAIAVLPFGLLSEQNAWGVFVILAILLQVYGFQRMKMKGTSIALMMVSPFVFYGIFKGNLDFLVLLGSTLPVHLGIWLLLIKPQMSLPLVFFLAYRLKQVEGWKSVALKFSPPFLLYTLFLLTGWMNLPNLEQLAWNTSVWPWGIPLGLLMVLLGFIKKDKWLTFAASPFLSPYLAVHSWVVTLLPYRNRRWILAGFIFVIWVILLQKGYPL